MTMNIIEKLIEFGYKEGRDFVVFGNKDKIDTIVIGEAHCTPRLIYHQYEIVKEFKPKIIGHEGFDEDSINDSSVYESFKEFYEVSKEIFYKIIENQNYREILEKILEEKYNKEVKESIPKTHEIMKESVSKFLLEIYPDIKNFHKLDENTKNEIRNKINEINSILSKLNSDMLFPIWTLKLELEFLKEVTNSNINKDELDKLVDKYAREWLFGSYYWFYFVFKFINGTHLVVIDDNEEKKEGHIFFLLMVNAMGKALVLNDLLKDSLIKKYQLDSNTKLSQILQKISKVVAIENTNNNNPTIENLKKILELVETFKMEIEKPEGLSNEVLKEVLKETKKSENEIKEKIDVLSSHNYDSIVKGIIKNLKENEKRFLEECKNNGIEKKDLRYILLHDICINTKIYIDINIDIKLFELLRMFMHTDNTIREKKMFETIKNLKDKSVIIMGDSHVINLEPKLKKLSEEEKRNILILHQRHILDKDDNILGSCVYRATHIYDIPELASLMNNIIKYHILSDEL